MSGWTDGWDDDDVDLEDDDDIFVEEEEGSEEDEDEPQGGGMFMGRLTQFISQVATAPDDDDNMEDETEEYEEEEEDSRPPQSLASRLTSMLASPLKAADGGWDDDDDLDLDDGEGDGWDDDDNDLDIEEEEVVIEEEAVPTNETVDHNDLHVDDAVADDGWDDDLDISHDDDEPVLMNETEQDKPEEIAPVETAAGWDEDLDLDDVDDEPAVIADAQPPPPPPPQVVDRPPPPPPHDDSAEQGWDEDLDLDVDEPAVPNAQPPAPPPPPQAVDKPPPPTPHETSDAAEQGWDEDLDLDDVDEHAVPNTQPPPPPQAVDKPPSPTPHETSDAAEQGWDEDLDLDDVDDEPDDEPNAQPPAPPQAADRPPPPPPKVVMPPPPPPAAKPPPPPPPPPAAAKLPPPPQKIPEEEAHTEGENGWDDSDLAGLEEDAAVEESNDDDIGSELAAKLEAAGGWAAYPVSPNADQQKEAAEPEKAAEEGGWADESGLEGLDESQEDAVQGQGSGLDVVEASAEVAEQSADSGWKDDGLEEINDSEPPSDQPAATDNAPDEKDASVVDSVVAPEPAESLQISTDESAESASGWEDDGLEEIDEGEPHAVVVAPDQEVSDAAAPVVAVFQPLAIPAQPAAVVDQVPEGALPGEQRDSTVAMASDQSGTLGELGTLGEEMFDPDEQNFGPVVDHLPPPDRPFPARTESIATQIRLEELDQDENEVGENTASGENSEEPKNTADQDVVDHVPVIPGVGSFRDSTIAVASQRSSTVMEDVWREDFDPNDSDYGPVVDHLPPQETPTPSVRSIRSLSSLAVQGAIAEEEDDIEEDASGRRKVGMFSGASVADSLAVVAPIAENDEENTVGQTVDGVLGDDDDTDTASNAPPTLDGNSLVATNGEPLVDHVPLRGHGRPTDASTLVLADPSEVSTVGDMTYEEMQYGPVVDHTPEPRPLSWQASAAASVVVAATKSECPDDLEDDIETYAMGTGDDGATLETSLGDEDNLARDMLVDHVPESHGLRRVNSASAIAEVQSIISTRDDEFGLVVDHTPIPPIGSSPFPRESLGPLAPLSECATLRSEDLNSLPESLVGARVEIDKVPASSNVSRADSTFAVKSIAESIDVDTIEELPGTDEFGPVVDHLPSVAPSVVVSRGELTTGALATLSELDFDGGTADADAEGWEEDDQELLEVATDDEAVADEFKEETPETRNKSVTFQTLDGAPMFPVMTDSPTEPRVGVLDAGVIVETTARSTNGSVSTQGSAYSTECPACAEATSLDCPCIQRILATEGDDGAAIVKRITPEGLPIDIDYSKLLQDEITKRVLLEEEVEKYSKLVESLRIGVSEAKIDEGKADDDKKQLEKSNLELAEVIRRQEGESATLLNKISELEGTVIQSESRVKEVTVDLQHAKATESALRSAIEELGTEKDSSVVEASQELANIKIGLQSEIDKLREDNKTLTEQNQQHGANSKALVDRVEALSKVETELREEVTEAEKRLTQLETDHSSRLQEQETTLQAATKSVEMELETTQQEVTALKSDMEQLSSSHALAEQNLALANEAKKSEWATRESNYQNEIAKLQQMVTDTASAKEIEDHFKGSLASVEAELEKRSAQVETLDQELGACKQQLHQSEAKSFALIKDSARMSKLHEAEISKLQDELETQAKTHGDDLASEVSKKTQLETRMNEVLEEVRAMSEVKEELKTRVQALLEVANEKEKSDSALTQSRTENAALKQRIQESEERLNNVEGERYKLEDAARARAKEVEELQSKLVSLETENKGVLETENRLLSLQTELEKQTQAAATWEERNRSLGEQWAQANEQNLALISQLEEAGSHRSMVDQLRAEVGKLAGVSQQKDEDLVESQNKLTELSADFSRTTKERDELVQLRTELQATISNLQAQQAESGNEASQSQSQSLELEEKLRLERNEHQAALEQLLQRNEIETQLRADIDMLLSERDTILNERRDLEEECEEMLVQLGLNKEQTDGTEKEIAALHDALRSSETANVRTTDDLREAEEALRRLELQNSELRYKQSENGTHANAETNRLGRIIEELTIEKADLKQQVDDLISANAFNEEELHSVKSNAEMLEKSLKEVEARNAQQEGMEEAQAGLELQMQELNARSDELQSGLELQIQELSARSDELEGVCSSQKGEIDRLSANLQQAEEAIHHFKEEANVQNERSLNLLKTLAHHEDALRQKDDALSEARQQMEDFHRMSTGPDKDAIAEMSRTIDGLSARLREAEHGAGAWQARVNEVEEKYAEVQKQLHITQEKLSSTEEALLNMELEMDLKEGDEAIREEYEKRLQETQKLLSEREEAIRRMESGRADLETKLASQHSSEEASRMDIVEQLKESKEVVRQREESIQQMELLMSEMEGKLHSSKKEVEAEKQRTLSGTEHERREVAAKDAEIEILKSRFLQLQQEKETLVAEHNSRDESIGKEIESLRVIVQEKNTQLSHLEQQLQATSLELSTSKNLLRAREEDLQRVSLELEDTRAEQLEATQRVATKVLESDMSKEEAENTDNMRNLIISLSQALEKSESQRADAIERLLRERKTNADSLKRLGESVKRFYGTLNGNS